MTTNERTPPTFAQQRVISLGLLLGMLSYGMVVAVMLIQNGNQGMATEHIEWLDIAVPATGVACAVLAVLIRRAVSASAAPLFGAARSNAMFRATLVPMAIVEGGCLFSLTAWLLNANMLPHLATALVLLTLSISFMPFRDPDATI
ncbi:MAG TPA: hypothetical protein VF384_04555 [Planctomycetota bacterium]